MNAGERRIQLRSSATEAAGLDAMMTAHERVKKSARRGEFLLFFRLVPALWTEDTSEAVGGRWDMDARIVAGAMTGLCFRILGTAAVGLVGMGAEALAQNYPSGPYTSAPPGYRAAPIAPDDYDDLAPLPPPGAYGRPPGSIQREALPAPGAVVPATPYGGGGGYADAPPPPRRYTYGPWEPATI
jgi:hypothetical protein